jgi:hypothetical protein
MKTMLSTAAAAVGAVGALTLAAAANDILVYDDPIVISADGGGAANKTKLVRLSYNTPSGFENVLVAVYGDAAGPDVWNYRGEFAPALDIFATRSTDDGETSPRSPPTTTGIPTPRRSRTTATRRSRTSSTSAATSS